MKNPRIWALVTGIISIIFLDQLSKALIVSVIPENYIGFSWLGGFFRIVHARNLGIAFSIGNELPDFLRILLFTLIPIVFLSYLSYLLFKDTPLLCKSSSLSLNRFSLVFIIGGGFGNLIDRIFRNGVIDFIDIGIFGFLGMERWPAFNIADSSIFLGVCFWILASFCSFREEKKKGDIV